MKTLGEISRHVQRNRRRIFYVIIAGAVMVLILIAWMAMMSAEIAGNTQTIERLQQKASP